LISGAITFRTPDRAAPPAKAEGKFELYNNRAAVDRLPGERAMYYTAFFRQSVRGLNAGSPVEYKGVKVGSVADVPYFGSGERLTFSGCGLYKSELFAEIAPHRAAKLAPLLRKAMTVGKVRGHCHNGLWLDVGTPERLDEARCLAASW